MKKQIPVDKNLREQSHELLPGFPFDLARERICDYDKNYFNCHWHPDMEFTLVLSGSMDYQVNGTTVPLKEGQGMFANANMLHTARAHAGKDCIYYYIRVHPLLICGHEGSSIAANYIMPLTEAKNLPYLHLTGDISWQQEIMSLLYRVIKYHEKGGDGYELIIKGHLCHLFAILYKNTSAIFKDGVSTRKDKDIVRLKEAMKFIQAHHQEKLTLAAIAASCSVSKSECCRLFKKILKQSPVEYLLHYRINQSLTLLLQSDQTILEISEACGFSSSSYYSEIFRRIIGSSPREYRKQYHE